MRQPNRVLWLPSEACHSTSFAAAAAALQSQRVRSPFSGRIPSSRFGVIEWGKAAQTTGVEYRESVENALRQKTNRGRNTWMPLATLVWRNTI